MYYLASAIYDLHGNICATFIDSKCKMSFEDFKIKARKELEDNSVYVDITYHIFKDGRDVTYTPDIVSDDS